jgi:hypothetical protein
MKTVQAMKINEQRIGGTLDDFLREEGLLAEVNRRAAKKLLVLQFEDERKKRRMTKLQMAKRMRASPATLEKILDPNDAALTLDTLERAANAVGCDLVMSLQRFAKA